jgi:hypothetical protein
MIYPRRLGRRSNAFDVLPVRLSKLTSAEVSTYTRPPIAGGSDPAHSGMLASSGASCKVNHDLRFREAPRLQRIFCPWMSVGNPGKDERDSGMKPNSFRSIPESRSASSALYDPDMATPGLALARADRRSDAGRWHSRPAGTQCTPDRDEGRFDAKESGQVAHSATALAQWAWLVRPRKLSLP